MSLRERTGYRDLTYSRWHRLLADLDPVDASLHYVDVDAAEFCSVCKEPLALIETARDVGQSWKPTTVLARLAARAGLPAYCVLYRTSEREQIIGFRVRTLPTGSWVSMNPWEYRDFLRDLRRQHRCDIGRDGDRNPATHGTLRQEPLYPRAATAMRTGRTRLQKSQKSAMPGKGKPFVRNDSRHRPGPGRPKRDYLEAMRALAWGDSGHRAAVDVIGKALDRGDVRAAQDVFNRAYGKPKETIQQQSLPTIFSVPERLWQMMHPNNSEREQAEADLREQLAAEATQGHQEDLGGSGR